MPLDFAFAAGRFAEAFALQYRTLTAVQELIGKALIRRLEAARQVDRATADFPIVRFLNSAVTLHLPAGHPQLTSALPPVSLGEHARRAGLGFVTGLAEATAPLRADSQETAIPRLLSAAARAVTAIDSSLGRFAAPAPAMFTPDRRTASDLFGLTALAWRTLVDASEPHGDLAILKGQILDAQGVSGPAGEPSDQASTIDTLGNEVLVAVIALTVVPAFMSVVIPTVLSGLKLLVLNALEKIEWQVLDLRAAAIEFAFGGLGTLTARGGQLVAAAAGIIGENLVFQAKFLRVFGEQLGSGIEGFILGLGGFLVSVVDLVRAIPGFLQVLTSVDASQLFDGVLGFGLGTLDLSLDDLLDKEGTGPNTVKLVHLLGILSEAEALLAGSVALPGFPFFADKIAYAHRQIQRGRQLLGILYGGGSPELVEGAPLHFHSDFPDLADALFGGGRRQRLLAATDRLGRAVRDGVGNTLHATAQGLSRFATTLDAQAAEAAQYRLSDQLAAQADHLTDLALGPEVARQKQPEDAVARAFESWLAAGGFQLIGEALPVYVGHMAEHWRAELGGPGELTDELTPTSPHILRKHARLGRVVLPKLTLHAAPGQVLDADFADVVASRFADAVREAYRTGRERRAVLAEIGGDR